MVRIVLPKSTRYLVATLAVLALSAGTPAAIAVPAETSPTTAESDAGGEPAAPAETTAETTAEPTVQPTPAEEPPTAPVTESPVAEPPAAEPPAGAATTKATTQAKGGYPSKITKFTAKPGPKAGEILLTWKLDGSISEGLVVETALSSFSPFEASSAPRKGWNWRQMTFPGQTRKVVLTQQQVAQAGAPLGSGLQLVVRTYNQSTHKGQPVQRWYGPVQATAPRGRAPAGNGSQLVVASYNVRMEGLDSGDLAWEKRAPRVAKSLASRRPVIAGLNEFLPRMHSQLMTELRKEHNDMGGYALTRSTAVTSSSPMGSRILYDTKRLQMMSNCPSDRVSCVVKYSAANGRVTYAPYARFRVRSTGEEFWFVAVHLTPGQAESMETLRREQAATVVKEMNRINAADLPIILAGDINSAQSGGFEYRPHQELVEAGFYDASASVKRSGLKYDTVNHFKRPLRKNGRGFGARLDVIMTKGMPGAARFNNIVADPNHYPSDHNLVVAELQLP